MHLQRADGKATGFSLIKEKDLMAQARENRKEQREQHCSQSFCLGVTMLELTRMVVDFVSTIRLDVALMPLTAGSVIVATIFAAERTVLLLIQKKITAERSSDSHSASVA